MHIKQISERKRMKNDKTKHRIYKNMTIELQPTGYEAQVLQKWNRTSTGYFLGTRTLGILLHAYPRRTQIFEKKKSFSFIFFLLDMSQK